MQGNQQTRSLRPRQAAEFLGIGESTLWRWCKQHPDALKPIRLSERVTVFRESDLAAFRDRKAIA
ncbi:helix-turn-helix transcriptional regulator [Pandoraea sputorum]|uniref:helix-turn-helix transcriptional regulator n=1 Tax=Pandoraea sputorum TaxID=93222 RepID=UPI001240E2B3|nr:helix-turn-helix domain-containing protein [Pandoraea sputorum]VVE49648.1 hypothetical protein PSP20601_04595 [Pandoraea sputorum]